MRYESHGGNNGSPQGTNQTGGVIMPFGRELTGFWQHFSMDMSRPA
jgi:hypothetical protein